MATAVYSLPQRIGAPTVAIVTTPASPFRLAEVPGVTPAKWVRIWSERRTDPIELVSCANTADALARIFDGSAHVALVREPLPASGRQSIALYDETTVVVVAKDHVITAVDDVAPSDLSDEPLLIPLDDPLTWSDRPGVPVSHRPGTVAEAIELAATGMGVVLVPQSLARLHHRRDTTYRPVTSAPTTAVSLVWTESTPDVEEFIGIVRGRRPNSSRGQTEPPPKRTAREKTLAKQAAREAAGKVSSKPRRSRSARRG